FREWYWDKSLPRADEATKNAKYQPGTDRYRRLRLPKLQVLSVLDTSSILITILRMCKARAAGNRATVTHCLTSHVSRSKLLHSILNKAIQGTSDLGLYEKPGTNSSGLFAGRSAHSRSLL